MSLRFAWVAFALWIGCWSLKPGVVMAAVPADVDVFLREHCADCHGGGASEGGFRLETLGNDFRDPADHAAWVRLFDQVADGTMPPEDAISPGPADRRRMIASLGDELRRAHEATKGTVLRRLNRREYENALNDLFGTHVDLASRLPEDGRAGGFDNVGEALEVSDVQIERYLESIDAVLDDAIADRTEPIESTTRSASYADTRGAEKFIGNQWHLLDDGAVVFYRRIGYPSGMLREANILDDHALATRLAYFLTRTTPDEPLLEAAREGRLVDNRGELDRHVERLLADPRSERFINDFADAWLNLREIEFTSPDQNLYPEFDAYLQHSMLRETRAFLRELVDENLGVTSLVNPDFAILNARLAEHYGVDVVSGPKVRRVGVSDDSVRGGILGHASVLKVSLPFFEAMGLSLGQRAVAGDVALADPAADEPPRRFVAMCATLGFHTPYLFPENHGAEPVATPYLRKLAEHRDRITPISGLSHPNQQGNNGHASELTWLTSAQRPGLAGFRNSVSIDQVIARHVGLETRFPYLALSTSGRSMSWNSAGVEIPAEPSPAKLSKALFVQGSPDEVEAEMCQVRRGRSILDTVTGSARQLEGELGYANREKLDGYLTAVRDLESKLQVSQNWITRAKPEVDVDPPQDINDKSEAIARQALMYEMIALALETDSTRTITFQLGGLNSVPKIPGVASDWHGLSHHGKDPEKIEELRLIEEAEFEAFAKFLTRLRSIDEGGRPLLDQTTVLFGSNLGNAGAHDWRNLPILVAGGGFRHGRYAAHDPKDNTPLANLFVSIAQHLGIEIDRFGLSTAESVDGLEVT